MKVVHDPGHQDRAFNDTAGNTQSVMGTVTESVIEIDNGEELKKNEGVHKENGEYLKNNLVTKK